jgi:DNA polymerase-1
MYLKPTDKHWALDIETDDLDATVVWVACVRNIVTREEKRLVGNEEIKRFIDERPDAIWVTHNGIKFDIPTLNRLLGTRIPAKRIVDTFVLSMLYSPSLKGGHSLKEWARRVGLEKVEFDDWTHYSEEMAVYCMQDVRITAEIFLRLTARMRAVGFTEAGAKIESLAWDVICRQQKNGFAFKFREASMLFAELREEERRLKERIHERFPPQLMVVKQFARARKANGEFNETFKRHEQVYPLLRETDDGGYEALDWVEFNLGSPPQRVAKLLELGWVPREFTKPSKTHPKGQPKATDGGELVPSLAEFAEEAGIEEVLLIAQWIAVNGRANAIGNWLDLYNHQTGCIHGNLWLAGSLRYRHDHPNTANIPAVRTKEWKDDNGEKQSRILRGAEGFWTYEARDLWTHRGGKERKLVGVDAKGIQLRNLAHYLNDEEFSKAILSEDPHEANKQRLGLKDRRLTKTITYATLMGAGDKRIATEAGVSLEEAKAAKARFFELIPGLPRLIKRLKAEARKTGRITLCDGSKVLIKQEHTVIPYLLQGDESRIMKLAMIYIDIAIQREGLDVLKVGDIHDEHQYDCSIRDIDRFIAVCHQSFKRAGEFFRYNLPIECDTKIGETWAETH